jgi:hypothetical protein
MASKSEASIMNGFQSGGAVLDFGIVSAIDRIIQIGVFESSVTGVLAWA